MDELTKDDVYFLLQVCRGSQVNLKKMLSDKTTDKKVISMLNQANETYKSLILKLGNIHNLME